MSKFKPSTRAEILYRRTYSRVLNEEGTLFETWPQTIERVIQHQKWLWSRALGGELNSEQKEELEELRQLLLDRYVSVAGRTLFLGGTAVTKKVEISNFNCSFLEVKTVHDVVDCFHLLLQGCGVGFRPVSGTLSGFTRKMDVEVIPSTRTTADGRETNLERYDPETKTWYISVGDTSAAWARSIGKILAGKFPAKKLVLDFSEIRPKGLRLKSYGWISNGSDHIAEAYGAVCNLMSKRAGRLLSKIDILDIINWLGTVLSSRRSAQIAIMDYGDPEWYEFATAKSPEKLKTLWHRQQSNNSLVFWDKPTQKELKDLFDMIISNGGSEPGLISAQSALARAPWWKGVNPCVEQLLANQNTCNLVELDVSKFKHDDILMHKAMHLISRSNYRQTLVDFRDGILQDAWHQTNEYLRLCGVGLTGIVRRPDLTPYDYRQLRNSAVVGTYSMADELGTVRPKNTTNIKPSGSLSKAIFDTTEGAHKPMSKYIFNNVIFSKFDPLVGKLLDANYKIVEHPNDKNSVLITLPISYPDVSFDTYNGMEVNRESAVVQLERYKMLQQHFVDNNTSITISYDPYEIKSIIKWFDQNWDYYTAVSFLFRNDPTMSAEKLGYSFLPQQACTKEEYNSYVATLKPVDIDNVGSELSPLEKECSGSSCPVR